MGFDLDIISKRGLQFFGKISASISHEIKNVLAVLNENAGLLEDLVLIAEKGGTINHERFKSLAGSMKKQVQRADLIVNNMNRFAHSVDEFLYSIDLCETLGLVTSLSVRFADMRGVELCPLYSNDRINITTNPFLLENLLWCCLDFATTVTGEGKTVRIIVGEKEDRAWIEFAGLQKLTSMAPDIFPSERERDLIRALDAEIETNTGAGQFIVKLPKKINL
ncbi:MAG: hypothetical protein WC560_04525 [Syntrophales bacterium]